MIRSLDDAERWYEAVRTIVRLMDRMARRYWDASSGPETMEDILHRDAIFREYEAASIQDHARVVLDDLDDLSVLLLFSVFESKVRDRTLEEMERELPESPRQPALRKAVADAREAVEHGSFGRVSDAYKPLDPDIKTQIDQVREYRNWVAHGRRGSPRNYVNPADAIARLRRFIALIDDPPKAR